jgi:hypothetical protein
MVGVFVNWDGDVSQPWRRDGGMARRGTDEEDECEEDWEDADHVDPDVDLQGLVSWVCQDSSWSVGRRTGL